MKTDNIIKIALEDCEKKINKFEWSNEARFIINHKLYKWIKKYKIKTDEFLFYDKIYLFQHTPCVLLEDIDGKQQIKDYLEDRPSSLSFFWDEDRNKGLIDNDVILAKHLITKLKWHFQFDINLNRENKQILMILLKIKELI